MIQKDLFPQVSGRIGTDESGKGDYFGPLVVAGIYLPEGQDEVLRELGVRDSKRISDQKVKELASIIKKGYVQATVTIGPARYNELYERMRNLNRLLAWAHARVIEDLLSQVPCSLVITDQFGDEFYIRQALMKLGQKVELIQRVKAEEDVAVAAASILARAEFLNRLEKLSQEVGLELPKGSSPLAEKIGFELVSRFGQDILNKVAKKHFKLTAKILNLLEEKDNCQSS
ncbi:MAG: ribonuclease HIII [Candidatus Aminicenantes bacterium]|nr:ribonuclease HIII [Candidatus Aminicenantes bacterium]